MTLKTFISLFLFLTTASFNTIQTSNKTYNCKQPKDPGAKSLEHSVKRSLANWDKGGAWHEIDQMMKSKLRREQLDEYRRKTSIEAFDEKDAWNSFGKELHPSESAANLEKQKKLNRIKKEEAEKTDTISKMIEYATKKSKPDVLISQLEEASESYYRENPALCIPYLRKNGDEILRIFVKIPQ